MRVKFHLSLIKVGCCTDMIYPHSADEETEGGRLRKAETCPSHDVRSKSGTRSTLLVCHGTDLPQDQFLERHLLGGQEAPLWITDTRQSSHDGTGLWNRAEWVGFARAVRLGNSSSMCTSVDGDNTHMKQQDKIPSAEASRTEVLGEESTVMWVPRH